MACKSKLSVFIFAFTAQNYFKSYFSVSLCHLKQVLKLLNLFVDRGSFSLYLASNQAAAFFVTRHLERLITISWLSCILFRALSVRTSLARKTLLRVTISISLRASTLLHCTASSCVVNCSFLGSYLPFALISLLLLKLCCIVLRSSP